MTRVISIFIALILLSSFSVGIRVGDLNIAGSIFSDTGTITWNVLTDFPVGCNVGEAVRVVGTTLTCVSVASDLNTLSDVNITNPQNADILSFNSGTSIWENTVLDVNSNIREFIEANDFNLNGVWDWNGVGTTENIIDILFSPAAIDLSAIRIVADMNSQDNTNVVQVEYNVEGLSGGDNTNAYLTQLQGNSGDLGTASAYTAIKTGDGNVTYVALNVGEGVFPVFQSKGDADDMNVGLLFDASLNTFSNVTAAFASDTNNVEMFSEDNDIVYVGNGTQFSFIRFDLNVVASAQSILPTFQYSDGTGGFASFIPSSTLDGFRQSGQAVWNISDLNGWATDDVNGNADLFWIRITRNAVTVTVPPIENTVTIAGATEFFWREDGNLFVSTVSADDFGVPTNDTICRSGAQIVDCLGSSTRYKWNVVDLNLGLAEINALRPVTFDYNANYAPDEPPHIGFIAEEVEVVSTLLVDYVDGVVDGVNYQEVIPVLTEAVQDLSIQVSTVDTNSQTACDGTDVLRGNGTCGSAGGISEADGNILYAKLDPTAAQTITDHNLLLEESLMIGSTIAPRESLEVRGDVIISDNSAILELEATTSDPVFVLRTDGAAKAQNWTMRMDISDANEFEWRYDNSSIATITTGGILTVINDIKTDSTIQAKGETHDFGLAGSQAALINIRGAGTGSNTGGRLSLITADDFDTTITTYLLQSFQDDLFIGPSNDNDALEYDGGTDVWNFNNPGGVIIDGQVTLGDNGDTVEINSSDWDISTTGVITNASMTSTQLTDGGTIGFDWVDAEIANTLTITAGSVTSTTLIDGGTIGFDWANAEVVDALTVSGGTLSSNNVGGTWTTTSALVIGDGGDAISINSSDWDISTSGVITNASMSAPQITAGTFGGNSVYTFPNDVQIGQSSGESLTVGDSNCNSGGCNIEIEDGSLCVGLGGCTASGTEGRLDTDAQIIAIGNIQTNGAGSNLVDATPAALGVTNLCFFAFLGALIVDSCTSLLDNKQNIDTANIGLDDLMQLRSVEFNWKSLINRADEETLLGINTIMDRNGLEFTQQEIDAELIKLGARDLGFIAEEVELVNPLLAQYDEDGKLTGINLQAISSATVKAVQEQQLMIEGQQSQINLLESELCKKDNTYSFCTS